MTDIPELGVISTHQHDDWLCRNGDQQHQQEEESPSCSSSQQFTSRPSWDTDDGGVHVYVRPEDGFSKRGEGSEEEVKLRNN